MPFVPRRYCRKGLVRWATNHPQGRTLLPGITTQVKTCGHLSGWQYDETEASFVVRRINLDECIEGQSADVPNSEAVRVSPSRSMTGRPSVVRPLSRSTRISRRLVKHAETPSADSAAASPSAWTCGRPLVSSSRLPGLRSSRRQSLAGVRS